MGQASLVPGVEYRKTLFKESRDRKITHTITNSSLPGHGEPSISSATTKSNRPLCIRYGYRSFDRQYALFDSRLGDYIRPALHHVSSDRQVYFVSPDTLVPGVGPVIATSPHIPDQHFFRGSFGGKDVMPLYRDPDGKEPNVTGGLLDTLSTEYGRTVAAEDLAAYVYALLGGQSYTRRFWNELETPGPRGAGYKGRRALRRSVRAGPPPDLAPYLRRTLQGCRPQLDGAGRTGEVHGSHL